MLDQPTGLIEIDEPQTGGAQRAAVGIAVVECRCGLAGLAGARAAGRVGGGIRPHDRAVAVQAGMVEGPCATTSVVPTAAELHDLAHARTRGT